MADIWRTRDRFGREVVLTDRGWAHILAGHPELLGREGDFRGVVETSDFVNFDADHANRENHYRWSVGDGLHLKVCVEYAAIGPGAVVTAPLLHRIKRRERRRWP